MYKEKGLFQNKRQAISTINCKKEKIIKRKDTHRKRLFAVIQISFHLPYRSTFLPGVHYI